MELEEVVLVIENTEVKCRKRDLIENSDYFLAMLEGDFIEKTKRRIKIEEIDLQTMNLILTLIHDNKYDIEEEEVLMLLYAACVLQFCEIKKKCLEKIEEIFCPEYSLKIWIMTELLDLKPMWQKAYYTSLMQFAKIKDSDSILQLNLLQLKMYLSDTKLKTDNEFSVFETVMKWWYQNNNQYKQSDLLKLLSCVDFRTLSEHHFHEIITSPEILKTEICDIIKCCYNIVYKRQIGNFKENCIKTAVLLTETNSREENSFPCLLVNLKNYPIEKGPQNDSEQVIYYDQFRRKRVYEKLNTTQYNSTSHILYYDHTSDSFNKLVTITEKLVGFQIISYRECIFTFGGEYILGKGDWNKNFWCYNSLKDKWHRKERCITRRHFQTCIVGSKLYIVGGTGMFRKCLENVLYYDFLTNWRSGVIDFPVFIRQMKCCDFMGNFFLFNINEVCGYYLNDSGGWTRVPIRIENNLLDLQFDYSIFSYKNRLYIKGKKLVEFAFVHNEFLISSIKSIPNINYDNMVCTVCTNNVYTLYKQHIDDKFTFEKYNLETSEITYIFKDFSNDVIKIDEDEYTIDSSLILFSFCHYKLVEFRKFVNENF
ncbi:kelch-like protein 29 isoform X1 [Diorhabda carinulata]|uniref:kelch-like protein 29 isoform X1 n=1 Tax=Diorhabda carinulata TaxID=1163345 RepID=UPI0025A10766|nr:kelch-like protein 29 isoform X1 [Diorhabda carinulata]